MAFEKKHEWMSVYGRRAVVGYAAHPVSGNPVALVMTEGGGGLHDLVREEDLERLIATEESRYYSHKKAKEALEVQALAVPGIEKNRWRGFTDSMTPRARGKACATLEWKTRYQGKICSRGDLIVRLLEQGYEVKRVHGGRRLESPDGTFLTEVAITKTGMDFAEYLCTSE